MTTINDAAKQLTMTYLLSLAALYRQSANRVSSNEATDKLQKAQKILDVIDLVDNTNV